MTLIEPLTMFDLPAEDPLPPKKITTPVAMVVSVEGLTFDITGDIDLTSVLIGREAEIEKVMEQEGIDRHAAAFSLVQAHYEDLLGRVIGQDGYLCWHVEGREGYTWSDEIAAEALDAIVPRYPKRFVGDDL